MPVIPIDILSLIVIVESVAIVLLGIVILSARRRSKRSEELLKIALGEVDIVINMGDYVKKHKKEILKNNLMRVEEHHHEIGMDANEQDSQ